MITAILAACVLYLLFLGLWPQPWPLVLGAALGLFLVFFGRHKHGGTLTIDVLARRSRFTAMSPGLKLFGCSALLVLSIVAKSVWPPLILFCVMSTLTVAGGIRLHDYLSLLSLPAAFLLLSGLALLWDVTSQPTGILCLPLFGKYLVLTEAAQISSRLIMARALGAVSCLYFLSLSTLIPEILTTLRKLHVPAIVTDLAVLIYRYIFILLSTYRNMKDAAASRLGYQKLGSSIRTTGKIYATLLGSSFQKAGACFDAMESRCYTNSIRFLHSKKPLIPRDLALFICLILGSFILDVLL